MADDHEIQEEKDEMNEEKKQEELNVGKLLKEAAFSGFGEFLKIVGNALKRLGS